MFMTTNTISASDARKNLYSLLDDVSDKFEKILITKNGKAKGVLVSPEEFESWRETLEIMSDSELVKVLRKSEEDIKAGRVYSAEEVYAKLGLDED